MTEEAKKQKRGLSISEKTNNDLLELCQELGVSVHGYLVNEIAKAVQRDRVALAIKKSQDENMKMLIEMIMKDEK